MATINPTTIVIKYEMKKTPVLAKQVKMTNREKKIIKKCRKAFLARIENALFSYRDYLR